MKVSLSFEFDNNASAEAFLRLVRERAEGLADKAPPAPAPTKRAGKKAKAEPAIAPGTIDGPVEARKETPPATKEQAQAALEAVFAVKGLETSRALLSRYGVQRLANMAPEKYGEFVAHAERVAAGGEV